MKKSIDAAPPYSIIFISDADVGEFLEPTGAHLQWNSSIVSIGCRYYHDGDTRVTLGSFDEVGLAEDPVFDGEISTIGGRIVVFTAHLDIILSTDVSTSKTRIRIWENHPTQPDDIVIAYG